MFWAAKRPIFKLLIKKSLLTAATPIQMEPIYQILGFYTKGWGVQRADRRTDGKKDRWTADRQKIEN